METPSVAKQMNRGMFLAPALIDDKEENPLLQQAKRNVEATAKRAEAGEADEPHRVDERDSEESTETSASESSP